MSRQVVLTQVEAASSRCSFVPGVLEYFILAKAFNKIIETEQKLMMSDLESANEFIVGVPKGNMVSPQIQELFMLVEFISKNQEKLKEDVEKDMPEINKLRLKVEFLEERLKKSEQIIDKLRNGTQE